MNDHRPQPSYDRYADLAAQARRTAPAFVDRAHISAAQAVITSRGYDWCTAVLGRAFAGLGSVSVVETQILLLADQAGLTPPLPAHIAQARAAEQARRAAIEALLAAAREHDELTWQTALAGCAVPVHVRANIHGRRYSSAETAPLRHVVPDVDARSGPRGTRAHQSGRALCETAGRAKPLRLGEPTGEPATCARCLAYTPKIRPAN